jgi:hypothetical protein
MNRHSSPYDLVHSKSLRASGVKFVIPLQTPEKYEGFEFFQKFTQANASEFACSRTSAGYRIIFTRLVSDCLRSSARASIAAGRAFLLKDQES